MLRIVGWALAGVLLWVTHGCDAGPPAGDAVEVLDSAGIRVVTSRAPLEGASWSVDPRPELVIGAGESDPMQVLFRVRGAIALSDGRIVVAHGPAPMVRWYDAQGRYLHGTGREGGGPGEFGPGEGAWIMAIWLLAADSIATWEHSARRMQVFDPAGRFARAVVLDLPPDMPVGAYPQVAGRLDDGFIAFLNPRVEPERRLGEVRRDSQTWMHYRSDGSYARELARLPGFVRHMRIVRLPDGSVLRGQARPPFATSPATAIRGDDFVYGSQERWEIAVHDTTGAIRMLVRRPIGRRAVTPDLMAAYLAQQRERAPAEPEQRRTWEQNFEDNPPFPDSLPAHRLVRADRLGMVWVQEYYDPGAETAAWSVFDTGGRWIADVDLPTDWQILEIGENYLLVLARNEFDVETVRRHTLRRH